MTNYYTADDLEILVATKNRTNLDFLLPMFPFSHFSNFNILIVNQSANCLLTSSFPSVKVLNSTEVGLSKSRNLSIKNASKKICLIADDDVVYFENFVSDIIYAFNSLLNPVIVTFNHLRIGMDHPKNQSEIAYKHNQRSILEVCSIEIAFNRPEIKNNGIYFDENFGLGSYFQTAEEYLFLKNSLKKKLDVYYYPSVIVSHPLLSSGRQEGKDELIYARSALMYKTKGIYVYFWLSKYLFFLFKKGFIRKSDYVKKFKVGLSGIKKFNELEKN